MDVNVLELLSDETEFVSECAAAALGGGDPPRWRMILARDEEGEEDADE